MTTAHISVVFSPSLPDAAWPRPSAAGCIPLALACLPLGGGTCLQDLDWLRHDEVLLDALGARRIPELRLMPGMTANISFQIEAKADVLRLHAAALRFFPLPEQVHPEDRHDVEVSLTGPGEGERLRSAGEKAEQARSRQGRIVWVQDGERLRAVPVTLGLMESQFVELVNGDLGEGQAVVTGVEGPTR